MLRKIITILIAIILCCSMLISCGTESYTKYSTDITPSSSSENTNEDEISRGYILTNNNDNIIKFEEEDYCGFQLKTKYDYFSDNPIIIYISKQQLNKLKDNYSDDAFSIPETSEEELTDCMYLKELRLIIAEYNEYRDVNLELNQAIKYISERKITNNFSYIYYILDLDYFGPVVFYAIFEKNQRGEWIYNTSWAYTESKKT